MPSTSSVCYMEDFDDILPQDGKFCSEILKAINEMEEKGEFVPEYSPKVSNGNSVVLIGKTKVFQIFRYSESAQKITKIIDVLSSNPDSFECFPICSQRSRNNNVVIWTKLIPLNSFKDVGEEPRKEREKFKKDVERALSCLHSLGYAHRDCDLDNIGINDKGQFCLFDFDLVTKARVETIQYDFEILKESMERHCV